MKQLFVDIVQKNKHLLGNNELQHEYSTRRFKIEHCYPNKHRLTLSENNLEYNCLRFHNKLPSDIKSVKCLSTLMLNEKYVYRLLEEI